jgi:DNA polymerase-4
MTRRIAHLDMDAFYASVELLRYPGLRGAPVVVGGRNERRPAPRREGGWAFPRLRDYAGRGVVTTATYEARAFGVSSGMGLMKAAALAPEAILLPADFAAYRHHSNLFKAAVAGIAPRIEDRGIDEIYADLSDLPEEALPLGRRIKQAVRAATGLSCSIGITPNKLLSKIASDLDKPDGLTLLAPEDVPRRIWPLPVRKINGIGPKAAARLGELGIATIGDLAGADPHLLAQHFSPGYVHWLQEASHGIDARPVVTDAQRKSFSRETTFDRDLHARHDRAILGEIFTALCVRVARDLQRRDYLGRTIGIKLRYADFRTVTRDLTLPGPTADAAAIRRAAEECLRRVPLDRRLRLLGVRVGGLVCGSDLRAGFDPPSQAELPFAVSAGRP